MAFWCGAATELIVRRMIAWQYRHSVLPIEIRALMLLTLVVNVSCTRGEIPKGAKPIRRKALLNTNL